MTRVYGYISHTDEASKPVSKGRVMTTADLIHNVLGCIGTITITEDDDVTLVKGSRIEFSGPNSKGYEMVDFFYDPRAYGLRGPNPSIVMGMFYEACALMDINPDDVTIV